MGRYPFFLLALLFAFSGCDVETCVGEECEPCYKKECGEDQGHSCGTCYSSYEYCSTNNQCVLYEDAPECGEFECGDATAETFYGSQTISCGTCADDSYCSSGQKCVGPLWRLTVDAKFEGQMPCIGNDGTLYVPSSGGYLFAVSPEGALKWKTSGIYDNFPVIGNDGSIYVLVNGELSARDPVDGSEKWRFVPEKKQYGGTLSSAVANDGTIYMSDGVYVHAVSSEGALKWSFSYLENEVFSVIVVGSDDALYVAYVGGMAEGYPYYRIVAVTAEGEQRWVSSDKYDHIYASLVIGRDDTVYIGGRLLSDPPDEVSLFALGVDGVTKWKGPSGIPMIIDEKDSIYACDYSNTHMVTVVAPDGKEEYSFHLWTGDLTLGDDGTLYNSGPDAYDLEGNELWAIEAYSGFFPVMDDRGVIYFGNNEASSIYAIPSLSTGPADAPWPMFRGSAKRNGRVNR
ncbi:MAG TPA: PQQ-binding-like beta-propeller repeat protein [bacterium]|nr:PQQ-binding-like beta-propeller repeat protein [bacterium]